MIRSDKTKKYIFVYLMSVIAFIGMVKYIYVNLQSILIAFSIETESGAQILSFNNFTRLFNEFADPNSGIWLYLMNTLKYFGMYMGKTIICFFVAYFLFKKVYGYKFYRVVFYLPCIISPIIIINIFNRIVSEGGLFHSILRQFGIMEYHDPLASVSTATNTILIYCLWSGFGTALLIFVGAMNRIPTEVLEAGQLDGCTLGREFFSLVLPLTWGSLSTMLLLTMISIFSASGPILYFTSGNHDTSTISFWIFFQTYSGTYNYPTAVGLFFTLLAIPFVFGGKWLMDKIDSKISY